MEEMDDEELTAILRREESVIFSRVAPEDKLRIVKLLQAQGEVVAVTGDGVNDAPALKRAAIGVAMGRTGTDVAKEAAELILLDDSFPTLVAAVREGRTIYNNLKKTVLASMTTNVAELVVVLLGLAGVAIGNWAIPILAIQILAIDLLAEVMPLTFLTFDPPSPRVMQMPPRDRGEHIMNLGSSLEVLLLGTLIGALAFANFGLFMVREGLTITMEMLRSPDFARASTLSYLTIAFCQFVNIMSRRYEDRSLFDATFFSNRILLGSLAFSITLILLVVYWPALSGFLSFAGPSPVDWLYILGAAALFLAVFEGMKRLKSGRQEGLEDRS
jgi:Ca2+-transporting ATPase